MATKTKTTARQRDLEEQIAETETPPLSAVVVAGRPAEHVTAVEVGPVGRSVYDAEAGRWTDVSPDDAKLAAHLHQQVQTGVLVTAVALHELKERRLHLALGCSSWKEYCETMLPIGRRQAYSLLAIGEQFGGLLSTGSARVQSTAQIGDVQSTAHDSSPVEAISGLGVQKLYALTRIPDFDAADLVETGEIALPSGKTATLDEIKAWTVKELSAETKAKTKILRDRIASLEEEVELRTAERDTYQSQAETTDEKLEHAKQLERLYGPRAGKLEDKQECVDRARRHLQKFYDELYQSNVDAGDPESLRGDVFYLVGHTRDIAERLGVVFHDVMIERQEAQA